MRRVLMERVLMGRLEFAKLIRWPSTIGSCFGVGVSI